MKKKTVFYLSAIAMIISVCMVKSLSPEKKAMSSLMIENVEALAGGEGESGICAGTGCIQCPWTSEKVRYVGEMYGLKK